MSWPLFPLVCSALLMLLSLGECRAGWGPGGPPVGRISLQPIQAVQTQATLTIQVQPSDAVVWVGNIRVHQTGPTRVVPTIPLNPGQLYTFKVYGYWGQTERVVTVQVEAGRSYTVNLNREDGVENYGLIREGFGHGPAYRYNGQPSSRGTLEGRLKSFTDDSGKPWLSFYGPDNLRVQAQTLVNGLPELKQFRFQSYPETHWTASQAGFQVQPGVLTVVVQQPDGGTICRSTNPQTVEDFKKILALGIEGLRKPKPYDPKIDPDPTKPFGVSWDWKTIGLLAALGIGVFYLFKNRS